MDILLVVAAILVQLLCSSGAPIYGWGANNKGQLGIGNTISPMYDIQKIPFYANSSLSPMKHIFVGPEYHLIELQNSEFYGSGDNSFNQLPANDSSIQFDSPAQLVDIPPYDYILPSGTFGLAFNDTSGELYGWGLAGGFLLGTSSGNYTPVPIAREFQFYGQGAVARAAVAHNAVFVTLANGTTWVAGTTPQVTLNGVTNGFVRMPFWDMVPLRSVFSTTSTSVCALSVNSSLFCWGDNDRGQLGLGHTNLVQSPQRVQYFDDYGYVLYQLQQGESHSIALTCDGKVFAWGQNQCGQLGIGSNASFVATPTEVQSLRGANIVEIISSARSVFARSAQNKWYAWGDIQSLGMNNTHTNLTTPVIHPLLEQLQITQLFSSSHANYFLGWNGVSTTTSRSKGCPATVAVCQNTTCDANAVCTNRQNVGYLYIL
jgi:alpha-tubulin suppressor-like RCC1 family protein